MSEPETKTTKKKNEITNYKFKCNDFLYKYYLPINVKKRDKLCLIYDYMDWSEDIVKNLEENESETSSIKKYDTTLMHNLINGNQNYLIRLNHVIQN